MLTLLFHMVLTASLWGTLTGLLIWGLRGVFRKRLTAAGMFWMWSVLLLKLIMPFGPQSAFSLFNLVHPEKLAERGINLPSVSMETIVTSVQTGTVSAAGASQFPDVLHIAAWIWIVGAAMLLLWFFASGMLLKRRLASSEVCTDERLLYLLQKAKQKLRIRRDIRLLMQPYVATPSLYGIFRPQILLPRDIDSFSDEELSYVFLHELSHYKRRDLFTNGLLTVLQLVHWFNPLIWVFFRKIREDMELATDEAAMQHMQAQDYLAYGRTLLTAVERFSVCRVAGGMLSMANHKSNIKRRLKRICQFKKPPLSWSLIAGLLVFVCGFTCLTDAKQTPLLTIPQVRTSEASAEISAILSSLSAQEAAEEADKASAASPVPSPRPAETTPPAPTAEPEIFAVTTPQEMPAWEETAVSATEAPVYTAPPQQRQSVGDGGQLPEETAAPTPTAAPQQDAVDEQQDEELETARASRTMLAPGTTFEDMCALAEENGSTYKAYAFGPEELAADFTADQTGEIHLYLRADTIDTVHVYVYPPGQETEAVQLNITPRTYFSYTIYGLMPGETYTVQIAANAAGEVLLY